MIWPRYMDLTGLIWLEKINNSLLFFALIVRPRIVTKANWGIKTLGMRKVIVTLNSIVRWAIT